MDAPRRRQEPLELVGADGLHIGVSLWAEYVEWHEMQAAALLVERLGFDSLWTWDHFTPVVGNPDGPNLECWQVLGAFAAITRRVRVGPLVSSVTYRHPAVIAKMIVTLDHVSGGRALLGLGAGWNRAEHEMYGIPFEDATVRISRLDEAATVVHELLHKKRADFAGTHYQLRDAIAEPKPVQREIPLLIGGGGERLTLPVVARHADLWNAFGTPDVFSRRLAILRRLCAEVRQRPGPVVATVGVGVIVRKTARELARRKAEIGAAVNLPNFSASNDPVGEPELVATRLNEYVRAGVRGFILAMPPPYDNETLERFALEVRPALAKLSRIEPTKAHPDAR